MGFRLYQLMAASQASGGCCSVWTKDCFWGFGCIKGCMPHLHNSKGTSQASEEEAQAGMACIHGRVALVVQTEGPPLCAWFRNAVPAVLEHAHSMLAAPRALQLCSCQVRLSRKHTGSAHAYTHVVTGCLPGPPHEPFPTSRCTDPCPCLPPVPPTLVTLAHPAGRSSGPPQARASLPLWSLRT